MTGVPQSRRTLIMAGAATAGAALVTGILSPARAQNLTPTRTMRGGANNYRPGAPIVERIGGGGFWMTGAYRMEMPQIVPAFGQPHAHLAYDAEYDGNGFETVFLRPVMSSASDTRLSADFVLRPA